MQRKRLPARRLVIGIAHWRPKRLPFEGPLEFSREDLTVKAEPLPMAQVRLLPNSIYHDAQEWNRGYMGRLAADRLLYTFRANADLAVGSAKPLGGWEQADNGQHSSELHGHFCGHFLSASAQLAASGDSEAKAKADYMVAELAKCQAKLGGKYLNAFPTSWFDRLDKGERVWAPFYTIHKIMAGIFDMYRLAGNRHALQVLEGMAAWTDEWTNTKSEEQCSRSSTSNSGVLQRHFISLVNALVVGRRSARKIRRFWCCIGSGVEDYSKLNDSIYWYRADGVYVNLFVQGWSARGAGASREQSPRWKRYGSDHR